MMVHSDRTCCAGAAAATPTTTHAMSTHAHASKAEMPHRTPRIKCNANCNGEAPHSLSHSLTQSVDRHAHGNTRTGERTIRTDIGETAEKTDSLTAAAQMQGSGA